ncbi:MAG: aliphatic sulfonate ABC transporter substrate-binding protein [Candidatus Diapherotrites archaeon]
MGIFNGRQARLLFAALVVLIIVGLAFAFFSLQKPDAPKKITMGTFSKSVAQAPYLVAKNKGWLGEAAAKHGATTEYKVFETLPAINEAFATGKLDFVVEADPPAITGKAIGAEVVIKDLLVTYVSEIVVPVGSGIASAKDFKGKKLAVLSGTSSHYVVSMLLKENGLLEQDIQMFDMAPADARVAFETGKIDAWAVWPPWIEQQILSGKGRAVNSGYFIQVFIVGREKFVEENPALTKDLVQAINKAKIWVLENEEESQRIVADEIGLPLAVVREAWPEMDLNASVGENEMADLQKKADFLFEKGLIKNRVDVYSGFVSVVE